MRCVSVQSVTGESRFDSDQILHDDTINQLDTEIVEDIFGPDVKTGRRKLHKVRSLVLTRIPTGTTTMTAALETTVMTTGRTVPKRIR